MSISPLRQRMIDDMTARHFEERRRRRTTSAALRTLRCSAIGPRQKNDAIVQALDSPGLTARLRFPLAPKEETWLPTTQRAAFGLTRPLIAGKFPS